MLLVSQSIYFSIFIFIFNYAEEVQLKFPRNAPEQIPTTHERRDESSIEKIGKRLPPEIVLRRSELVC